MNQQVTDRINESVRWREAFEKLRRILLECGLTEELKWEEACYTLDGANIALMHGFKDYCALLFFKGALMADPDGILVRQTENVQSGRQIRFRSAGDVTRLDAAIRSYVGEAVRVEQAGLKIVRRETEDYEIPVELQEAFDTNPGFREAFYALTPGRQRGYLLHFAAPKLSKTREERIAKWMDAIFDGIGLRDEYRQANGK